MVGLPTWHFMEVVEKGMGLYPLILGLLKAQKKGRGRFMFLFGLQSQPLIMPENGGIANLALQGGSGEGYGSLPTDFGVVEDTKEGWGKVYDVGDLNLESIEDEGVATMDGVFKGAFRALGDKTWFGGGCFGGCHRGLWWLIMDEEDNKPEKYLHLLHDEKMIQDGDRMMLRRSDGILAFHDHFEVFEFVLERVEMPLSENDILDFDGAVQLDTFQLKKSTNIVGSRKIDMIWSLSLLGVIFIALTLLGFALSFLLRASATKFTLPGWSKRSFHQALDLIFMLNEMTVECIWDILRHRDCLDWFSEVSWVVPTFVVTEGESHHIVPIGELSGVSIALVVWSGSKCSTSTMTSPTPSFDSIVTSPSQSLTPLGNSDFLLEKTDAFLALDPIPLRIDNEIFDADEDIILLQKLLNIDSTKDLPPQDLNNDSERDIIFLEKLLEDEPSEAKKSEVNPLIREPSNTF
nr:hypothetical protein [Tanacetum cinerariifolium]